MTDQHRNHLTQLQQLLSCAPVADALDRNGRRQQILDGALRPLRVDMRLVGRAKTLTVRPVDCLPERPYATLLAALEDCRPGDVLVVAGGSDHSAVLGGLIAPAARRIGVHGFVVDGAVRDTAEHLDLNFPTFSRTHSPADSYGREEVVAYDLSVRDAPMDVKRLG
jgi:regulator of RNase E activity RraA